jgi:hypothetical protein
MRKYWKRWEKKDKRIDLRKWESVLGIFGSITNLGMKEGMLDGELRAEIVERKRCLCQVRRVTTLRS